MTDTSLDRCAQCDAVLSKNSVSLYWCRQDCMETWHCQRAIRLTNYEQYSAHIDDPVRVNPHVRGARARARNLP